MGWKCLLTRHGTCVFSPVLVPLTLNLENSGGNLNWEAAESFCGQPCLRSCCVPPKEDLLLPVHQEVNPDSPQLSSEKIL